MPKLRDVLGQEKAINQILKGLMNGQLGHALLFSGPQGAGKTTTALALAQALNCQQPLEFDACGRCLSCRKAEQGNLLEVKVIEPRGNYTRLEQIKDLHHWAALKAPEQGMRVAILGRCEYMTEEAANSLLRILEEPPERLLFILTADQEGKLPQTIISRCRKIYFQELRGEVVEELLRQRVSLNEAELALIGSLSQGSALVASSLASKGQVFTERQDAVEKLNNLWGSNPAKVLTTVDFLEHTEDLDNFLSIMELFCRDLLVWRLTAEEKLILNRDLLPALDQCRLPSEILFKSFEEIELLTQRLKQNLNRRLSLEVMAWRINSLAGQAQGRSTV